ncbi:glycosyltransferase family 4 protein [Nostoc sp. PA-18-2419]|uniref:glycosyltransferase family 4 protein n=1 Tax=Nostoc sp. PA-18-2419 TaxID=2575443 RepID=UPI0011090470|nr:glycosyltransferase family 4 protein [Nostoc sp. PA-18-2419]
MNSNTIYFIQPKLSFTSGGSLYNVEIVKRLEQEGKGENLYYPLDGSVSGLLEQLSALPSDCILVIDALYLTISEFNDSLNEFLPYAQRTYLMLHHLESLNTYYSTQEKKALWSDEARWLKAMKGIIVPSFQLRNYILSGGIETDKIVVASPGIDQALYLPNLKQRSQEQITLISIGTFYRRKGQLELVEMLAQMETKNFRLHLIGDCEEEAYKDKTLALIKRAGLQDAVIVHGRVPQKTMLELLSQSDLYISASTYESYSMSTAEAVANGLPVLAYATGAIADWIEDGVNGILIELGKHEQFFMALKKLLTDRNQLNQLGKEALNRTANLSFNTWEQSYRDFLQVFTY